jgi:fatty-acyl-CoA synthase
MRMAEPDEVLLDLLRRQSSARPDAEAVVFPSERVSFAELDARAELLARSLLALGVRPLDNVAVMLPNCVDYAVAIFGITMIGARVVPVNLRFKETELINLLADSDSVVLLAAGPSESTAAGDLAPAEAVARVFPQLRKQDPWRIELASVPRLRSVVCLVGANVQGALTRADFDGARTSVAGDAVAATRSSYGTHDLSMIMFTSGTTARPKGAMITHEAVVRQAHCIADEGYRITERDRFWTPLPMFHTGGMMSMLACIAAGATYFHVGLFSAETALDQLERERITVAMPTFPPLWLPVLEHPRFDSADLRELRLIQLTSVPEQGRIMQARFPQAKNILCTGMTESTSYFTFSRPEDPEEIRLGSCGYILPTVQVKIVDPQTGVEMPAGSTGEAYLKGVGCFVGYYNAPEVNAEVFTSDGWFRTGDLGVFDAAGRYEFVGRIKDMLKVGGENVAAAEVEDYLMHHPSVRMVQVVAAPDRRYIEVPVAFIELNAGTEATEQEIIEFCLGKIATFKVPRYVRFITEWPMSGTKIQKYKLREAIAAELTAQGIEEAPRLHSRA